MRDHLPPAILIGGSQGSAISVTRSLGRRGVPVYLLGDRNAPERFSRYAEYIPIPRSKDAGQAWAEYLLGPRSNHLRGSALLACSDLGIELILQHREELSHKYLLDISEPAVQASFLNKLTTYRLAAEAGIPTPRFWVADGIEQVRSHEDDYPYPLLVKPLFSHKFTGVFGQKFLLANDFEQLLKLYSTAAEHEIEVLLLEKIPGPDDRLCSYFTYIDESGAPLVHFTKRVIRRYPENEGLGCYHITDWNPLVRDLGLRLFTKAGLRGLGNVEFKWDDRDGRLKIIEVNARFTAVNGLVAAAGYDLAFLVYSRLIGRKAPVFDGQRYQENLRMWYPGRDFMAYTELRRTRGLTFKSWLGSVMHRQVLPYFRWYDPAPSLAALLGLPSRVRGLLGRSVARRTR